MEERENKGQYDHTSSQENTPDIDDTPLYVMDKDEDENLYSLDGDEDKFYEEDDEEESERGDRNLPENPFSAMISIMLNPVEGWKNLKRARFSSDQTFMSTFLPLITLSSLLKIAAFFYDSRVTLGDVLTSSLISFISFFFGFYIIFILAGIVLPSSCKGPMKSTLGKIFILINLSTLALFYAVGELLPMLEPVLVFLPLWTLYLISRGVRILRLPKDKETSVAVWMSILIVGIPMSCAWIFTKVF